MTRPIVIEDKVWIGIGATVLPGVRIGYGAIVGANSVVTHDVPPMTVVGGNPARAHDGCRRQSRTVHQGNKAQGEIIMENTDNILVRNKNLTRRGR